jgi:hypothetical protein
MLAGFAAGAINSVAGGGTLLSFPTLLLLTTPIIANATNTLALVPASLSSMWGYRNYVKDAKPEIAALALPSLAGGFVGALWVVKTGDSTFRALIPWLIFAATLLFLVQQPIAKEIERRRAAAEKPHWSPKARLAFIAVCQFFVSVYGGFFGAGAGIMILAALGFMGLADNIHRANGIKNFAAACMNGMAAVTFIAQGKVDWTLAAIMAVASICGGYGGAGIARRVGQDAVRKFIVVVGFAIGAMMLVLNR